MNYKFSQHENNLMFSSCTARIISVGFFGSDLELVYPIYFGRIFR